LVGELKIEMSRGRKSLKERVGVDVVGVRLLTEEDEEAFRSDSMSEQKVGVMLEVNVRRPPPKERGNAL
jgi:hypothetical protein